MFIGIDFDNTIVCYDQLFHNLALERNLTPKNLPISKQAVRDYLREIGSEDVWIEMQGLGYGPRMGDALPYPGAIDLIRKLAKQNLPVAIVSHKTKTPYGGPPYDLHQAAFDWLNAQGFCSDTSLKSVEIYFELSREDKFARIKSLGCSEFIDDLPEFLTAPEFPTGVNRVLFDPNDVNLDNEGYQRLQTWCDIGTYLLSEKARLYVQ